MHYQHCPSSPLPLFERITSCYCVDREGQELGREAGLEPNEGESKEEPKRVTQWALGSYGSPVLPDPG